MNRNDILPIARELMDKHGLTHWRATLDNAKRRAGQCNYSRRTLSFSAPVFAVRTEDDLINTVLHEIAHALTPGHGHDAVWRRKAIEIGCTGKRCFEGEVPEAPWTGVHDGCTQTFPRHRRSRAAAYCPPCVKQYGGYNEFSLIHWVPTASMVDA